MNDFFKADYEKPDPQQDDQNVSWAFTPPGESASSGKPAREEPRAYVTYAVMGVTILVYILQMVSQALWGFDLPATLGAKVNDLIAAGQVWRLITPVLLHGSLVHVGFNMYALYLFGPRMEMSFGHWRFAALYVLSGFAGNVFSMMFTQAASLGSSTAIFGLLGAYGVYVYQNRKLFGEDVSRASLARIIQVAAINLLIGLSPGIDNWGHVGGLIGGSAFAWLAGPLLEVRGFYPFQYLADRRRSEEIWQGIAITGGWIFLLAVGALYLMGR